MIWNTVQSLVLITDTFQADICFHSSERSVQHVRIVLDSEMKEVDSHGHLAQEPGHPHPAQPGEPGHVLSLHCHAIDHHHLHVNTEELADVVDLLSP